MLTKEQSHNLQPELVTTFNAVIADCAAAGVQVIVHSAYRSTAYQERLYANRFHNPNPVAKPGYSPHEWGVAIDATPYPRTAANWHHLWDSARKHGLHLGEDFTTKVDPPHFELTGFVHGSKFQKWTKPDDKPKTYPQNVAAQGGLLILGYLTAEQARGGDGPKTQDAIRNFQRDHQQVVDGIAGPVTSSVLAAVLRAKS